MIPEQPTPEVAAPSENVLAVYASLERDLDRFFPATSDARKNLIVPMMAVHDAMHLAVRDPAEAPAFAAALDVLEDVIEALLRKTGWPTAMTSGGARP